MVAHARQNFWVHIGHELPEFDEDVLVYVFDNVDPAVKYVWIGRLMPGEGWRAIGLDNATVTHWMPLPEPPPAA